MALNISDDIFDTYYDAVDWLLGSSYTSNVCRLVYPPLRSECDNCVLSMIGDTSTNIYRHGGPAPFDFGSCPICGGNGYRETETTESIRLRVYHSPKEWKKIADNIAVPDASAMIIGFLTDLSKIKRANEIQLLANGNYGDFRYVLAGEPFPHGFGKNRYFAAFLKRV